MSRLDPRRLRRQLDIGRPYYSRYQIDGFPHHPSRVLQEHSHGRHRLGELYDEMDRNDTYLTGLFDRRAKAVGALPRLVVEADSKTTSARSTDLCRFMLGDTDLEELQPFIRHLAASLHEWRRLGTSRAISFLEVEYLEVDRGRWKGMLLPGALHERPMWHFCFDALGKLHYRPARGGKPVPVPEGKVLQYRSAGGSGWPKTCLMDLLFWAYQLTTDTVTSTAIYNEIFAMPVRKAEYEPVGDPAQDAKLEAKALALAEGIQEEYAVAIPKGVVLDFLEASRSGNPSYLTFLSWLNRGKALMINGEINTAGLRPGTGAFASDQVADQIRRETVEHDARVEMEALATLCEWAVRLNMPPTVEAPTVVIDTDDAEEAEKRQQALVQALEKTDDEIPASVWRRAFGYRAPRPGEPTIGRAKKAQSAQPASPPPSPDPDTDPVEVEEQAA